MSEKTERRKKIAEIETALRIGDVAALRSLAAEEYGLVEGKWQYIVVNGSKYMIHSLKIIDWYFRSDRLRRECWPLLLDVESADKLPALGDRKTLRLSRHAGQVKLDVDRSIKRFPEKMPEKQRTVLQEVKYWLISSFYEVFSNSWT